MSEIDKFFEELPTEDKTERDIFGDKETKQEVKEPEKETETEESTLKNRRERRLAEKYQAERESAIALNERVKILSEQVSSLTSQQQYIKEHEGEIDPRIVRAFGSDTPQAQELGKIFQGLLDDTRKSAIEQAKADALKEIEERQSSVLQEQKQEESYIDQQLVSLEEEHGIDLTSNAPSAVKARREFLGLVEKLSPKDSQGSIKEYADFDTAFEIYKGSQTKVEPNRAKELANRSMQTSTGTGIATAPEGRMTFKRATQEINRLFNN